MMSLWLLVVLILVLCTEIISRHDYLIISKNIIVNFELIKIEKFVRIHIFD